VVLDAFRESVRESGKAAYVHSHVEVLPFNVGRGNQILIQVANLGLLFNPGANGGAVTSFSLPNNS